MFERNNLQRFTILKEQKSPMAFVDREEWPNTPLGFDPTVSRTTQTPTLIDWHWEGDIVTTYGDEPVDGDFEISSNSLTLITTSMNTADNISPPESNYWTLFGNARISYLDF